MNLNKRICFIFLIGLSINLIIGISYDPGTKECAQLFPQLSYIQKEYKLTVLENDFSYEDEIDPSLVSYICYTKKLNERLKIKLPIFQDKILSYKDDNTFTNSHYKFYLLQNRHLIFHADLSQMQQYLI